MYVCVRIYVYIHTYIHTYIHIYILMWLTNPQSKTHTISHIYIYTYIHTYIHAHSYFFNSTNKAEKAPNVASTGHLPSEPASTPLRYTGYFEETSTSTPEYSGYASVRELYRYIDAHVCICTYRSCLFFDEAAKSTPEHSGYASVREHSGYASVCEHSGYASVRELYTIVIHTYVYLYI